MTRNCVAAAAACFALGCSTGPQPAEIERTNAAVLFGIEACETHLGTGISLANVLEAEANGRSYEAYNSSVPRSGIVPPAWKLDGMVWVGMNERDGCDVVSFSGSGPASRDAVVAKMIGHPIRKWSRMQIIDPKPGDARDAVCTTERLIGSGSRMIVMTTDLNPGAMNRRFIATALRETAENCTSKIIP